MRFAFPESLLCLPADAPREAFHCDITTSGKQEGKPAQMSTRFGEMCDGPRSSDEAIGWR